MIKVFQNSEELSRAAAELILDISNKSIEKKDNFSLVLSGGSSPKQTYKFLAQPQYRDNIRWDRTFLFWGDERFVPQNDPLNNYKMANDIFIKKIPVPGKNVFSIPTEGEPSVSAGEYENKIKKFFNSGNPSFDLILLGLGENGHTASLFPNTDILREENKLVKEVFVNEINMYRISMTANLINKSKNILFLVFGEEKAEIVSKIIEGNSDPVNLPAQLIKPSDGTIRWYLDKAAASKIKIT
jgi:6-phosphogluconolactonase